MSFATLIFSKSDAVLFVQISGVGFMLAIAYLNMRIADLIVQDDINQRQALIRVLIFLSTLSYYPLAYWSLMGMETGLLTLLIVLGVYCGFKYVKNRNSIFVFEMAGCLGLAYMTRNESIIFAILVWLYIILETPSILSNRGVLRHLVIAAGLYLFMIIAQLVFQALYYGEILPNTYTLKLTGMPLFSRLRDGIGFIMPFLIGSLFLLVVSITNLIHQFRRYKLLLLSIVLAAVLYQIYIGGDPWPYWRILSPSIPFLLILFIYAASSLVDSIPLRLAARRHTTNNNSLSGSLGRILLIIELVIVALLVSNWYFLPEFTLSIKPYYADMNQYNVNVAIVLDELTTKDATVGVTSAGTIPFFTGRKAIDFLGKSDRYIAHLPPDMTGAIAMYGMRSLPGHNKYDLNYSIKVLKPTYVQGVQWAAQDISLWAKSHYIQVEYKGISLLLLRGSPAVLWSKLELQ